MNDTRQRLFVWLWSIFLIVLGVGVWRLLTTTPRPYFPSEAELVAAPTHLEELEAMLCVFVCSAVDPTCATAPPHSLVAALNSSSHFHLSATSLRLPGAVSSDSLLSLKSPSAAEAVTYLFLSPVAAGFELASGLAAVAHAPSEPELLPVLASLADTLFAPIPAEPPLHALHVTLLLSRDANESTARLALHNTRTSPTLSYFASLFPVTLDAIADPPDAASTFLPPDMTLVLVPPGVSLRAALGLALPSDPHNGKWQESRWLRGAYAKHMSGAARALRGLALLVRNQSHVSVPHAVARQGVLAGESMAAASAKARAGDAMGAYRDAREAERGARRAFYADGIATLPHYPKAHMKALYIPLFSPMAAGLVLNALFVGVPAIAAAVWAWYGRARGSENVQRKTE